MNREETYKKIYKILDDMIIELNNIFNKNETN